MEISRQMTTNSDIVTVSAEPADVDGLAVSIGVEQYPDANEPHPRVAVFNLSIDETLALINNLIAAVRKVMSS